MAHWLGGTVQSYFTLIAMVTAHDLYAGSNLLAYIMSDGQGTIKKTNANRKEARE